MSTVVVKPTVRRVVGIKRADPPQQEAAVETKTKRQRAKNRVPNWASLAVGTEVWHEVYGNKWTAIYRGPKDAFEWRNSDGTTSTGSLHGFAMSHLQHLNTCGIISRKTVAVNAWTDTYMKSGDGKTTKMDSIRS